MSTTITTQNQGSPSSTTLKWPIDTDALYRTFKVSAAATTIGGIAGASIGFGSHANPYQYGGRMAVRYGLISLVFMGSREYLISPSLLRWQPTDGYTRRFNIMSAKALGKLPEGKETVVTFHDLRWNRVLDSATAGSLTAAGASFFIRQSVPFRAAFTGALVFSILQLTGNHMRILRLYLLGTFTDPQPSSSSIPTSTTSTSTTKVQSQDQRRLDLIAPQKTVDEYGHDTSTGQGSFSARLLNFMSYFSPLTPITDQEYLDKLEKRQNIIQVRLRGIEKEEQWLFEKSQEKSKST
ncbi:hypothetical protein BCR39DRAFT_526269 [Naematelia encephala]|uniref:Uncharacterized protein n=1 Tax=Naematelia encephala TaxID=71784 RepID=A0A1Y2B9I5_9TREE|nr:hypothetical protein BCR39DRAFT_526269 [Naematelia encephala]